MATSKYLWYAALRRTSLLLITLNIFGIDKTHISLAGQVTHPSPSISLCAQSLHWIKACFCVPFAKIKTFCTNVWVLLYKNFFFLLLMAQAAAAVYENI